MAIIVRSVCEDDGKFCPQIFLGECLYKIQNCCSTKELIFQKELKLISASKECMLYHYWYFKNIVYKFEPHACNRCHDILIMAYELKKHFSTECKRCGL